MSKIRTQVFVEDKEKKDYELVYGSESMGGRGSTGVLIFVLRLPETRAAQEQLSDDHKKWGGRLTPFAEEKYAFDRAGREVERQLDLQATRLDPKTRKNIDETKSEFAKCFTAAGLGPIFMEPIENRYWPKSYAGSIIGEPWYVVTTPIGYIEIGWRKRVINIDWARTTLKALVEEQHREPDRPAEGDELFPEIRKENYPTLGEHYIHAYGYEKATEYLKVLAKHAEKQAELFRAGDGTLYRPEIPKTPKEER